MNVKRELAKRIIRGRGGNRKKAPITLATSLGKITKADADYTNYWRERHCEDCLNFISPGTCIKVAGDISMVGTCRLWSTRE